MFYMLLLHARNAVAAVQENWVVVCFMYNAPLGPSVGRECCRHLRQTIYATVCLKYILAVQYHYRDETCGVQFGNTAVGVVYCIVEYIICYCTILYGMGLHFPR